MSSVSVPLMVDDIVEGNETFEVILKIPPSVNRRIRAGVHGSITVTITDSTSKYYNMHHSMIANY